MFTVLRALNENILIQSPVSQTLSQGFGFGGCFPPFSVFSKPIEKFQCQGSLAWANRPASLRSLTATFICTRNNLDNSGTISQNNSEAHWKTADSAFLSCCSHHQCQQKQPVDLKGSTNASINSTSISTAQTADLGQPSSSRESDNSTGIEWPETEALTLTQRRASSHARL